MSLQGLDRKAMEAERLARQRKRTAPDAPSEITAVKRAKIIDLTVDSPEPTLASETKAEPKIKPVTPSGSLQFPRGTIKKTWVFRQSRHNDIKIEEVLQNSTLTTAVLSSFQWNMEWLFSKLGPKTKTILVMGEKDIAAQAKLRQEAASWANSLRVCFPPMPGQVSCMHSKLMLLFHPTHLRIAIPSANLVKFDWGETGVMENTVFLIDLPRRSGRHGPESTHFGEELLHFLTAMRLDSDVLDGLKNFDFTETANIAFVHTIGGSHLGQDAVTSTGYPCLGKAVSALNMATTPNAPLQVDFAASSVGSLRNEQIGALYGALRGDSPVLPTPPLPKSQSKQSQVSSTPQPDFTTPLSSTRVLFPTHTSVAASKGGTDNGGTICIQKQYFTHPDFPRQILHDYKSCRAGILSHNKIILARSKDKAFAYVGSANMSQSAWGTMVWDRKEKKPKLNARNWECGVLMPVPISNCDVVASARESVLPYSVFANLLDIPFEVPARKYEPNDEPWYFMN